jgi:hypothetical protein
LLASDGQRLFVQFTVSFWLNHAMQPGVRDVNQLNHSLRAIEQICAFARISLNLQDLNSFEDACSKLLDLVSEHPYYQPGYGESMLLCLKV